MFDEQQKPEGESPEDIFNDIDAGAVAGVPVASSIPSALSSGRLKPITVPTMPPHDEEDMDGDDGPMEIKQPILKRGKFVIVVILAVIILIAGLTVFYTRFRSGGTPKTPAQQEQEINQQKSATEQGQEAPTQNNDSQEDIVPVAVTPLPTQPVDADGDGLTDDEEAKIGTNANSPDSDADGLTDKEEVLLWHTDPLKKDTDGDTYLDGEEVSHGYSPIGPGKLFQ